MPPGQEANSPLPVSAILPYAHRMAESIQDAQNRVLALNSDDRPFFYEPTAVGIHATWKYADQKWLGFFGAGVRQGSYDLYVTLDPDDGTWEFDETSADAEATVNSDGLHGEKKWQSGSQKSFTLNKSFALASESKDRQGTHTGQFFGYRFDTDEIKQPLIDALTAAGYSRKKGFFGKLFGG